MSEAKETRSAGERSPIEEIVHIQQNMARTWSMYVIGCINRLQTGIVEPGPWLESYGRYASETARQVAATVSAFQKLGGRP